MLGRRGKLSGYSAFIAKVRECAAVVGGEGKSRNLTNDEKQEAMKGAITWCIEHEVLKAFFEAHGSEVVNMLYSEWKLDDALVVEREEGREERTFAIARNALAEGAAPEFVRKITGLDIETLRRLMGG